MLLTVRSATPQIARLRWQDGDAAGSQRVVLGGLWTVSGLRHVPNLLAPKGCTAIRVELGAPGDAIPFQMDTAGALVLSRAMQAWRGAGIAVDPGALTAAQRQLVDLVASHDAGAPPLAVRLHRGLLGDIGRAAVAVVREAREFFAFLGELVWQGLPLLVMFWRVRWREIVAEVDAAGLRALGIVGLLSFLIGMVMAYQAGETLATYGANIYIVNLVAIITLRELGPLLTAILVAGRTGSSYAAQIGTMQITEEVDALRALGLSPFETLVFPKVLALVVTLPLLSLFADVLGLLGGGVVASTGYGLPWREYVARIPEVVSAQTLAIGLVKAPVFAVIIALVGCMQGLRVSGSAAAVGRATTVAVVQAIFLVIVIDAAFSVFYNLLGI